MKRHKILVLSGPNLNMLGKREVSIYGGDTLGTIHEKLRELAVELDVDIVCAQNNSDMALISYFEKKNGEFSGVVLNAGAYTHYCHALRRAIELSAMPCVEVHMSNVYSREEFRHKSVIAPACAGSIVGFGINSYLLGLKAMARIIKS